MTSQPNHTPSKVSKRICVIGAGPAGLAVLKYLSQTSYYKTGSWSVIAYEQGIVEENIDHCILATGFQMDFPFFDDDTIKINNVPLHPPLPVDLYNSRRHVFPLAKHLFPMQSRYPVTSVAFMTLLFKVAPLPVAEAQARAVVRAFADPASLNLIQEADSVLSRSCALVTAGASSPLQLAKAWFHFIQAEQWDYRDDLFAYAAESGDCPATKVAHWEKEFYANKDVLRAAWVDLEKKNESQSWVEGIGEGGLHEWVEMIYRLLHHARNRPLGDSDSSLKEGRTLEC
ncbi:hypothetical protein OG21DRAFT_1430639 [Imleria badia]|nr:hypothetical protein OG21DRAFT_1430639 [Imleria badia]